MPYLSSRRLTTGYPVCSLPARSIHVHFQSRAVHLSRIKSRARERYVSDHHRCRPSKFKYTGKYSLYLMHLLSAEQPICRPERVSPFRAPSSVYRCALIASKHPRRKIIEEVTSGYGENAHTSDVVSSKGLHCGSVPDAKEVARAFVRTRWA